MGKKWGWFYAVKKAFSPADPTKVVDKKDLKSRKSKRRWFGRYNTPSSDYVSSTEENITSISATSPPSVFHDAAELVDHNSNSNSNSNSNRNSYSNSNSDCMDNNNHVYTVSLASAAAAAQAAAEAVWLSVTRLSGKSKEETSAIRIQATFRGYMARKVFRAMRGLSRLKTLVQGQYVNRQASTTLRCMQTLARVQSQIRDRRIRMSEENHVLHQQRQKKRDKEMVEKLNDVVDGWNDSPRSKEQAEARLQRKQEASMRRERALAYAFSHQKTIRNKFLNPLMELNSSIWGWSWLERWMSTRPWEMQNNSTGYVDRRGSVVGTKIIKSSNSNKQHSSPSTTSNLKRPTRIYHSLSAPMSCAPSLVSLVKGKDNEENTRNRNKSSIINSSKQQHQRRHSITGFSMSRSLLGVSPSTSIDMGNSANRKSRSRPASPLTNKDKIMVDRPCWMGYSTRKK